MKTHVLKTDRPELPAAYVANGVVGLRLGRVPLPGGTALLNGFMGVSDVEKIEAYAPAPYPVRADLHLNGVWLSERPDLARFEEQRCDFATGELVSRFTFRVHGVTGRVEVLTFCSRTFPTVTAQEIAVTVDQPCRLTLRGGIDPAGLAGRCLHRDQPNTGWLIADGALHWESAGGIASCGAAFITDFAGDDAAQPQRNFWGYRNDVHTDYAVAAEPGRAYRLRQLASLVPSVLHAEPEREAIRLVRTARHRGFDAIRAENRAAWADLWKGRVQLVGAESRWQEIADAAFFYLHSSVHASSPCSIGPWGLSQARPYFGHVFWDCETFSFPPVLLTAPTAARAMLDYRSRLLPAYRNNAALNGYRGAQVPWQSGTHGGEVLPAWAASIFLEQHISLDVAFAFAQYAHATGDEIFVRQQAWPFLAGVADWIVSRATATARGYEIRHITGIDESIENIHNNGYVNMAATVVLDETIGLARRLGFAPPASWQAVRNGLFIPVDPKTGAILKHDAYEFRPETGDVGYPEPLAGLFPFGYRAAPALEEATVRYYLEKAPHYMHLPMVISQVGVFAARLGDRRQAADLFHAGVADFVTDPFLQFIEYIDRSAKGERAPAATTYMANMGGFLMACLYGLSGIQLGPGAPADWCVRAPAMPALWDAVEVERIWVRGQPAHLLARHGDAKARIECG